MVYWIVRLSPEHGPIKEGFELTGGTEVLKKKVINQMTCMYQDINQRIAIRTICVLKFT